MEKETVGGTFYIATERLWLTEDQTEVVKDGDPRAATLYASVGTRIPEEAAIRFGLVKGEKADPENRREKEMTPKSEEKAAEPYPNKAAEQSANKKKSTRKPRK